MCRWCGEINARLNDREIGYRFYRPLPGSFWSVRKRRRRAAVKPECYFYFSTGNSWFADLHFGLPGLRLIDPACGSGHPSANLYGVSGNQWLKCELKTTPNSGAAGLM